MTNEQEKITQSHLLVVEGKDEEYFFGALLRHAGLSEIFQVMPIGGKDKLRAELKTLRITPGFGKATSIGIVRDGDGNNEDAFDRVCSALEGANLSRPSIPLELSDGEPRISVLIMPPVEIGTGRMLEDLCLAAVTDDPAMRCVDEYFNCLGGQAGISHKINAFPKARLHAFLASRSDPELRLGEAAQRGYFPLDSPVFKPVADFLIQLAS